MTATVVNGLAVIDNQPTPAPLKRRDGTPVLWVQTRRLTLADGSAVYGCAHCEHTAARPGQIRAHLAVHRPPGPPTPTARRTRRTGVAAELAGMTLQELTERLRHLEKVEADLDAWRRRALTAERRLAALRRALAPDEDT